MTHPKSGPAARLLLLALLLGLLPLLGPAPLAAQVPQALAVSDTLYEIRLASGETYVGRVVSVAGDQVTLETVSGVRVQFRQAQVAAVRRADGRVVDGVFWMEDPNLTRLMFAPTGRTVRAGEGYVGVFELFFPFASYGVTDWLTLAGGTPVFPEAIGRILYIAPKARVFSGAGLDVSAGVLAMFDLQGNIDEDASVGILYGVGTWGTPDRSLTGGAGWGFAGTDVENRPVFLLGGESRVSRRVKLITENYLISYREREYDPWTPPTDPFDPRGPLDPPPYREVVRYAGLASAGFRIIGERLSADAGLGLFVGEGETLCCLPLVNFVYNFGGGR
jgi:hypothetical protein